MNIVMPQLGETVLEGVVSVWYKKPGDRIAADESLFEVETEKVSTEIPSPVAGVVREILVPAGKTVAVGTALAVIETESAQATSAAPTPSVAAPAPASASAGPGSGAGERHSRILARSAQQMLSPVVRRLLGEAGLQPQDVRGSGRGGRITREDVLAHIARAGQGSGQAPKPVNGSAAPAQNWERAPAPSGEIAQAGPDDRIVPLNRIRKATAAHMVRSLATSPHTLQAVEVDFHRVEEARRAKGPEWKAREGYTLSYLPFICTAVCTALAEFPHVNASFGREELIVHKRIHLGIAVDLGFDGLVAPVVRDANLRNLRGIAAEIQRVVERARAGALQPDELKGGTYTISNSGSFGTLITAPIINQPQVAILSTDGVTKKPVVIEAAGGDAIAVRPVGVLAQSFDHRAFDGAYSAAFLRRVKQELEQRNWLAEIG